MSQNIKQFVSIIIPCYNAEKTLGLALKSAVSQTYDHCEIIVVDDGSSDRTLRVASNFKDRIQIIEQDNKGASAARNAGYKASKGEWIQFLDSDDFLYPTKIEHQINLLKKHPEAKLISARWGTFQSSPKKVTFKQNHLFKTLRPLSWFEKSWSNQCMIQTNAWLTSRSLIEKQGLWNESLSVDDDGDFFSRMILGVDTVYFSRKSKTGWRVGHHNRLSKQHSKQALQSAYDSVLFQVNAIQDMFYDDLTQRIIADRLTTRAFELYLYEPKLGELLLNEAQEYGGSTLSVPGGPLYHFTESIFGWRRARRLQGLSYKLRDKLFQ